MDARLEQQVMDCISKHDAIAIVHDAIQQCNGRADLEAFMQLLRIQNQIILSIPATVSAS